MTNPAAVQRRRRMFRRTPGVSGGFRHGIAPSSSDAPAVRVSAHRADALHQAGLGCCAGAGVAGGEPPWVGARRSIQHHLLVDRLQGRQVCGEHQQGVTSKLKVSSDKW